MSDKPGPPPLPKSDAPHLSVNPNEAEHPPSLTKRSDEVLLQISNALNYFLIGIGVLVVAGLAFFQTVLLTLPALVMLGIWVSYLGWELMGSLPKGPLGGMSWASMNSTKGKLGVFVVCLGFTPVFLGMFGFSLNMSGAPIEAAYLLLVVFGIFTAPLTFITRSKAESLKERQ